MKHIIRVTAIALAAALLFTAYSIGRRSGISHSVEDAELFITSFEEPEDGNTDLTIYIDLDGQLYEHGYYIG